MVIEDLCNMQGFGLVPSEIAQKGYKSSLIVNCISAFYSNIEELTKIADVF